MNNKFLEIFGKIYMVKNNKIIPIEAVKLRDIPELEDIIIITISEEEIEQIRQEAKKEHFKKEMQELKGKLEERKKMDGYKEHADAILHELKHCRINHPDDSWPWKSFDFVHQCSVMMEEAGEAVRAANTLRENSKGDLLSLYNELAQTGAMCLRIMEQIEDYALRLGKESGA